MAKFFHWATDKLHEFFQWGFMFNFWLHLKKKLFAVLCWIVLVFFLLLSSSWLFSHAAALSDWRHRLGDESSQLQSYKSQPSWCGFDWDPGICCSFSKLAPQNSLISLSHPLLVGVCMCCVYQCVWVGEWMLRFDGRTERSHRWAVIPLPP